MTVYVNWPPIGGAQFPIPQSGNVDWSDLTDYLVALANAQGTGAQKFGIRIAVLSPVTVLSATDCVIVTDLITPGAVDVQLPAGVNGQLFVFVDGKGDAGINNITITPNGTETINNTTAFILSTNYSSCMFVFCDGNWAVVGSYGLDGTVITYTPDRVLISDGSGNIAASGVSTTTLAFLDATSSIQDQLDDKASTGSVATVAIDLNNHITNATDAHDASAISVVAGSGIISTDVQSALVEIQTDVDTRATSAALTAHTGASSGVHGVTGSVVGTTDAQVLTEKDYDGGTASNTSRITVPKAASATLSGLTRKQGTLLYDTTLLKLLVDNGSSLVAVGSGSSGIKNYISNPNDASAGWTASGAGISVSTESTSSNFPDNITQTTCIKILRASGSDYVRTRFTVDQADYAKLCQILYDYNYAGTAGDYTVTLYTNTASDYSGTYTQVTLPTTNVPAGKAQNGIPALSGANGTQYMELRINGVSGTTPLYLNQVTFTTGVTQQGAAIGDWQTYTPSGSYQYTTNASYTGYYRRVGSSLEMRGTITFSGTPSGGSGSPSIYFALPSGLTINTTVLMDSATQHQVGSGRISDTGVNSYDAIVVTDTGTTSTHLRVLADNAASTSTIWQSANTTVPFSIASGDTVDFEATIPIAEWAGSGTLNLGAGAQVEFVSNSSTSTSSESTSFAYGPSGSLIVNYAPAGTTPVAKRVRFQNPIQSDDLILIETDGGSSGARWQSFQDATIGFQDLNGGTYYGAAYTIVNSTDVDVNFYSKALPSLAWSSINTWRWRVRKCKASSPVGFGLAGTDGSAGLYKPGQAPGYTGGAAIPAGDVGETGDGIESSLTVFAATGTWKQALSVTLQPGRYTLEASAFLNLNGATVTGFALNINTSTATAAGLTFPRYYSTGGTVEGSGAYTSRDINISVATTFYINVQADYTVATPRYRAYYRWTRVA